MNIRKSEYQNGNIRGYYSVSTVAAASQESLSSAVGVVPFVNAVNNNDGAQQIKTDTVFSNSEPVSGGREVDQGFGEVEGIAAVDEQLNLFNDPFLQLDRKFFEFPLSA